jgi:tetratricopeptide (TPR) repeat protein
MGSLKGNRKARHTWCALAFFVGLFLVVGCQASGVSSERWDYKSASSSEAPDISVRIEFLEDRLVKRPKAFLEMAELAGLYLQRGKARRTPSDVEKSQEWVEKSLSEFDNTAAKLVRADYLQMHHRFAEAAEILQETLQSQPLDVPARVALIKILLAQGKTDEAKLELARLPESPLSSLVFLQGQVAEASGDIDGARSLYQAAIRGESSTGSKGESARMRAVLARLEMTAGNLEEAEALLESAHSIPVEQPLTEILRAELRAGRGEFVESAALLRSGYEQYRDPTFLVRLGEVEERSGKTEAAQKTLATAVQLLRNDSFGHERDLALALHHLDPQKNIEEIQALMKAELDRRRDPETLRIKDLVLH